MADKAGGHAKGRGRARGRARGNVPPDGAAAAAAAAAPPQPTGVRPLGASVPQTAPTRAHHRGVDRPGGMAERNRPANPEQLAAQFTGKLKLGESSSTDTGNGNGNGNGVGRGVMRGKRDISQIICTKPADLKQKQGSNGDQIKVVTNYFKLEKNADWKLYLFHVDFTPEEDHTGERKKLLKEHHKTLGDEYLFDGMQLYTSRRLKKELELTSKKADTGAMYKIKIKFIKELGHLDSQFLQILNILLRRSQDYLGLQLVGRNYYNPRLATKEERYRITVWPGFLTSIRQQEQDIMLNVDVTHKFLREETFLDILQKFRGDVKTQAIRTYAGSVVMTKYNEKTYRIDDIDFNQNPRSFFPKKDGSAMSYEEYYRTKYNIKIRVLDQPLLISKPKKRDIRRGQTANICLIPELCLMTGLTEDMRNDFNMMKSLAQYMRMTPDKRVEALKKFNKDLFGNAQVAKELKQWGLKLSTELATVNARIVPAEDLYMSEQKFSYIRSASEWNREMRNRPMNRAVRLVNWTCIYSARDSTDAYDLVKVLIQVAVPMGMIIERPEMIAVQRDNINDYVGPMNSCAGKQLVMVLLPNNRSDRYNAIKKHLSVVMGIPSQCVLQRTVSKKQRLMSVATKIAIQMNCKLGGEVWNVLSVLSNTMFIGYDAYHDSIEKNDSYGAVVASLNKNWTRYIGQVSRHSNREEITNNFCIAVKVSLEAYIASTGAPPNQVIVYRDGVGDGQIEYVKCHEVAAIRQCLDEVKLPEEKNEKNEKVEPKKIKMAFVIVSKRINTRLFTTTNNRNYGNPLPGTVVDDVITLPERYDFFLVSQSVNQGTVSPTSYNVIEDNTKLGPDKMQRIAYKQTHLYYNWQGTVRVPAPCMYAHKLAFITGQSLHCNPHISLRDKLWFL